MRRFFVLMLAVTGLVLSGHAAAKRNLTVSTPHYSGPLSPPNCSTFSDIPTIKVTYGGATCEGLDSKASSFMFSYKVGVSDRSFQGSGAWGGSCKAGAPAGNYDLFNGYQSSTTGKVLQYFGTPKPFAKDGCMVATESSGNCFTHPSDGEVAPGVVKAYCTWPYFETGEDAGADGEPSVDEKPYAGDGNNGGGGGSGGDDGGTGGGGTGGGDTGGGGTGGGSGGGGGDTGGGDTGGGSGGDNGGGGGGGGGSGGNGQENCGAPGQAPCRIDESGTPSGEGLFDKLMDVLKSIGDDRDKGIEDIDKDEGKDTTLPISGIDLPVGSCTDPVIPVRVIGRTFTVPICDKLDVLRSLFTWFYGFAFMFAAMAMVARATSKS